jgi:hypothetical protein
MLPAFPFVIIVAISVSRLVVGPGWGLPLLAVGEDGPTAAASRHRRRTLNRALGADRAGPRRRPNRKERPNRNQQEGKANGKDHRRPAEL